MGRWLSIDPLAGTFPYQSCYVGFDNNPIYWRDPTGAGGEVTADKANKTITVDQKVFYWKNKEGDNNSQISNQEEVVKKIQAGSLGSWDASFLVDMSKAQDGSDKWTVTYNTVFVPIEAGNEGSYERIAKQRMASDPTADRLNVKLDVPGRNGSYSGGVITINPNSNRPLVETYSHERAHSLGLHEGATYPQLGLPTNGPNFNGKQNATGPAISYAASRTVQITEVRLQVQTYYNLIQQSGSTIVRIGFYGAGRSNPGDSSKSALPFLRK